MPYSLTAPVLESISDFLYKRSQKVFMGGQTNYSTAVLSGVPQGTVLGPLLFLCYINDLPRSIKSTVIMYADDSLVYNIINSVNDCTQFQNDILLLEK